MGGQREERNHRRGDGDQHRPQAENAGVEQRLLQRRAVLVSLLGVSSIGRTGPVVPQHGDREGEVATGREVERVARTERRVFVRGGMLDVTVHANRAAMDDAADTGWTFYTPYSTSTKTAVVPAVVDVGALVGTMFWAQRLDRVNESKAAANQAREDR